jgi:vanillate O-demethylase ferredoxin subunit
MNSADRLTLVVSKRVEETDDILSVELVGADGQELPRFEAGAHVDVHVHNGLVRQYSLCNSPDESHRYRLGILRTPESRGGSSGLHAYLAEGGTLEVSRPRNAFRLRDDAGYAVLVAGGIGITPLLSMAHRLHALDRPFELHYCVKSRGKAAFLNEIEAAPFRQSVVVHCDDEAPEQRLDPAGLAARALATRSADLYMCGPGGFMDWVTATAIAAGWAPERIFSERFGASATPSADAASFTVTAARSRVSVVVDATKTIAEALREQGISVPVSCEQGICGTCLTRVIDGIPDHRDLYQTDSERAANAHITLCCSRSKSANLVLDL